MGASAARLAELGRKRLAAAQLGDMRHPMLRDDMCSTCACKLGSVPNGCLQTQLDFLKTVADGKPFLCHSPKDGRMCAGWVRARAEHVANPMPKGVLNILEGWEYSPAEEAS